MDSHSFLKKIGKNMYVLFSFVIVLSGVMLFPRQVEAATVGFALNTSGASHIGWMWTGSTWDSKNGWAASGYSAGQGDHKGTDYYADDWNLGLGNADCGQAVLSPLAGNIIYKGMGFNNDGVTQNGYGYEIIIRADANSNFAYRAVHLQKDSMTGATHVNMGDQIGRMGGSPDHTLINGVDYWSGNSTACHTHSVLYKNITQNDRFGRQALSDLSSKGGVLGGTLSTDPASPDTIFATPFYNDATPNGSGQSACATYNQAGVTFFSNAQCTGSTVQFTTTGYRNLTDYNFNDAAKSMSVQGGWSARVYSDINRGGTSVCITGTKWDMTQDKYDNGTFIVANGSGSITGVDLFSNGNCTAPVTDTTAPTGKMTSPGLNSYNNTNNVTLTSSVTDNMTGVAKVDYYGWSASPWSNQQWIYLGTATASPYTFNWNTSGIQDGGVFLTFKATDNAGNQSGLIWDPNWTVVTIDRAAPSGVFTAPVKNSNQTGSSVPLTLNVSDNYSGVAKVDYYVWSPASWSNQQWIYVGTTTGAPWTFNWSIAGKASTYVYVSAILTDKAGNQSGMVWDPNWTVFNIVH